MKTSCARHPGRPAESSCATCSASVCSSCAVGGPEGVYCSTGCVPSSEGSGWAEEHGDVLVVPGTRRALVGGSCAVHGGIPALMLCARCGRRACAVCIVESTTGSYCSRACAEGMTPVRGRRRVVAGLAAALALAGVSAFFLFRPSPGAAPLAALEPPAAEEVAAPAPVPLPEVKPEPPPPPPVVAPQPEPAPAPVPTPEAKLEPVPPVLPPKSEPAPVPPPAPPVVEKKPEPPPAPPVVEKKPEPAPPPAISEVDRILAEASARLLEAGPAFDKLADGYLTALNGDRAARAGYLERSLQVERLLGDARGLYAMAVPEAPEPAVLRRRLEEIDDLLRSLRGAADRVRARLK